MRSKQRHRHRRSDDENCNADASDDAPFDTETDDAYRERAELQRRQLFVAMTRARDRLWLGSRA